MNEICKSELVELQENGIIRNSAGVIIGRLDREREYKKIETKDLVHNMDARVWVEEFLANDFNKEDIDFGLMIGWFANAIMCGHDNARWDAEKKIGKLKDLLLLTDDSVSNISIGDTQLTQWEEFIKCFPEEGSAV